jgi:hypothetical protein
LRWLSLMRLVPIHWAKRVWALPFLTVLAPPERDHQERGQRHKKLTDWARQMLLIVRRWVPERFLVLVTDSSFAVITLLWRLSRLAQPNGLDGRPPLDLGVVCPPVAHRSDLAGGPCPSRPYERVAAI